MEVAKIFSELEEVRQEIFRRKVKNFQIAEHLSLFKGSGYEIHSINQWRIGEPMINVDWTLSLRTWPKKVYKVDRVETKNAPLILVADISPSVFVEFDAAASRFRLLLHLIGGLGFAANYFHDPVGIMAVSDKIEFYLRPKLGQGQIFYVCKWFLEKAGEFERAKRGDKRVSKSSDLEKFSLDSALEFLLGISSLQRSVVILSDFTDIISGNREMDFKIIEALSSKNNWNVVAIFLDDPREFSWRNAQGIVRVRDVETGIIKKIKAGRASEIRRMFCRRREELQKKLKDAGVDSTVLSFGEHFNKLSQFLSQRR